MLNDRETLETKVIRTSHFHCISTVLTMFSAEPLIHSYFNIVKREMIDILPKAISTHACKSLEGELAARTVAGALQA